MSSDIETKLCKYRHWIYVIFKAAQSEKGVECHEHFHTSKKETLIHPRTDTGQEGKFC